MGNNAPPGGFGVGRSLLWLLVAAMLSSCGQALVSPRAEHHTVLASPGLMGQWVKGVYFFPGESAGNLGFYTIHPRLPDDQRWNSDHSSRVRVMRRIADTHANTLVMSYWGDDMQRWSPMLLDVTSLVGVLDAVQGLPLVIMPAIESGFDPDDPAAPHWKFSQDFPIPSGSTAIAPGLVDRIGRLVALFRGRMHSWARMVDRNGTPRYVVNILHVYSDHSTSDELFARAFGDVAAQVKRRYQIDLGFTLDIIDARLAAYVAKPATAGPFLRGQPSVIAVQGFGSEVWSPVIQWGRRCWDPDWRRCEVVDNNRGNLENLAKWKGEALRDWAQHLPVILDVSNGFDGRIIWKEKAFWGDNLQYREDRWRNWQSELKSRAISGITFNAWNGYTEGWVAAPSREHGDTVYRWLTHLMEVPVRECNHMHYVNGVATRRVFGAICEKWIQLGADRSFGAPVTEETPTRGGFGRVQHFADGKSIYWAHHPVNAHEVHGLIAQSYRAAGEDRSCLGLPIADTEQVGSGRRSRFQRGTIDWQPGDTAGRIRCP